MGSVVRACLQSAFKAVNYVLGLVGVGIIMYSLRSIGIWYLRTGDCSSIAVADRNPPWFVLPKLPPLLSESVEEESNSCFFLDWNAIFSGSFRC